jgi:hypothetical protein
VCVCVRVCVRERKRRNKELYEPNNNHNTYYLNILAIKYFKCVCIMHIRSTKFIDIETQVIKWKLNSLS